MQDFREHAEGSFSHIQRNKQQNWNMLIGFCKDFKTESFRITQENCLQCESGKKHMMLIRDQESHEVIRPHFVTCFQEVHTLMFVCALCAFVCMFYLTVEIRVNLIRYVLLNIYQMRHLSQMPEHTKKVTHINNKEVISTDKTPFQPH